MKTILIWLLAGGAACAQPAISPPVVGGFGDSSGCLHRVVGIPGNFVLGDAGVSNVLSADFSSLAGLVKTDTEILIFDASFGIASRLQAASGPALFAFDQSGAPALVFFSGKLFQFAGSNLVAVDWRGDAVAIASSGPQSASVILRLDRRLVRQEISLPTGDVESETSLAGIDGPLLLFSGGNLVFTRDGAIVVRDSNGVERSVSTGIGVASFETMGGEWVAVHEAFSSRVFALRIGPQNLEWYQLPEVTP